MKFFKYRPLDEYTFDTLKNNRVFFSNPLYYNDIFEFSKSKVDSSVIEQLREELHRESETLILHKVCTEREIKLMNNPENFRVFCLSTKKNNRLMWSHYANSHKGICLGFEAEFNNNYHFIGFEGECFQNLGNYQTRKKEILTGKMCLLPIIQVEYYDNLPDFLNQSLNNKNKFKSYHYIKDSRWKYENEWRIVVSKEIIRDDLMYFDREQLKSITFGFNVEKDLKEKTIELIQSLNYKVDFFQIIKTNGSYELTTEKCLQQ